jgi:hypothetical protein
MSVEVRDWNTASIQVLELRQQLLGLDGPLAEAQLGGVAGDGLAALGLDYLG